MEVEPFQTAYTKRGGVLTIYEDCVTREMYSGTDLDFTDKTKPDYWEKLKHQYAGMAMQGILSSDKMLGILGMQKGKELDDMIGDMSVKIATTLVNRLKEEEKCKE